ncbi:hypothetical protein [Rhodoplanes sp. Z2-YC6860]|uniref:hypothetical protein n=1 Tax=Rhodoplanes sp. Z2-YC6860 TaxID=674703 RepID=UPI0012EE6889|nr:hypothetical protein [Rhodoplanes sp. Z2-YC6860]
MKHLLAGAILIAGLLGAIAPASAQETYQDTIQDTPREAPARRCHNCPAPRDHYDTQEIIRTSRDVDRSRVINTQSEVVVGRRLKESNHLVIHENETRNVGVIQHNHTVYEVEPRYVMRVPKVTVVSYVTQRYHVVEQPAMVTVPVPVRRVMVPVAAGRCASGNRYDRYSRYEAACRRMLRVRG